jgi:hypothetical protein
MLTLGNTLDTRNLLNLGGEPFCPAHIAADCPFKGCGKRAGGPKRTLDLLGDCHASECPKAEVEEILQSLGSVYGKVGAQGAFKLAFTIPEAKARMALALAVTKLSHNGGSETKKVI